MYLRPMKTMMVTALRNTFDGDYVNDQFRNIRVSIEYPEHRQDYPGIWLDFEPIGELEIAGIGHTEYALNSSATAIPFTRWRFQGFVTYTAVAMSSNERDMLIDELLRIFAFGAEHPSTQAFRKGVEDNPLIAANMDFGTIGQRGFAASPGTPWNTDEVIYEATLAMNLIGEFVSDQATGELLPLTEIRVLDYAEHEPDPSPGW